MAPVRIAPPYLIGYRVDTNATCLYVCREIPYYSGLRRLHFGAKKLHGEPLQALTTEGVLLVVRGVCVVGGAPNYIPTHVCSE